MRGHRESGGEHATTGIQSPDTTQEVEATHVWHRRIADQHVRRPLLPRGQSVHWIRERLHLGASALERCCDHRDRIVVVIDSEYRDPVQRRQRCLLRRLLFLDLDAQLRQDEREPGASVPAFACRENRATVEFRQLFHDGEPKPQPTVLARQTVGLPERSKTCGRKELDIPMPVSLTATSYFLVPSRQCDGHCAAAWRELHAVRDQIPQHLLQTVAIAGHEAGVARNRLLENYRGGAHRLMD